MSRRIQQNADARARAAREREEKARQRALRNEQEENHELARLHRNAAELQADAAADAETLLELDQKVEGDRLDD